jgi:hypothetical protein
MKNEAGMLFIIKVLLFLELLESWNVIENKG